MEIKKLSTWKTLWQQSKNQIHHCKLCFNKIDLNTFHGLFNNLGICSKCLMKMDQKWLKFYISDVEGIALYKYDETMKGLIYQFKGCKDIELCNVFIAPFKIELNLLFKNYVKIPMPSYKKDDEEREFNHVKEMFKFLKIPEYDLLIKTKKYKQSARNFKERKEISKVLVIKNGWSLTNKNVLLIDDICTTGATLEAVIKMVKRYKPRKIKILVAAKRVLKDDRNF